MFRILVLPLLLAAPLMAHDAEWPDAMQNHRPIVRWWWPADLSPEADPHHELEQIAAAGFGGVEIRPAPPLRNRTATNLEWLSPAWIDRFSAATKTADRLGLKLDLSNNGPSSANLPPIPPFELAIQSVPIIATTQGGPLDLEVPAGGVDCLGAWPKHGPPVDLLPFIDLETHQLHWDAPPGTWRIYGIGREAKNYPDYFSTTATANALAYFADAFLESDAGFPRSSTLETFEQQADWTSALVGAFQHRRGYDLRTQLPALYGDAEAGTVERVVTDYRETLADLRRDTLITWHKWANDQGSLSRTHINGITGNPIDLHGVPDIPGMLIEGLPSDDDLPLLTFAASAAHLHAKPLIAATVFHSPRDPALTTPAEMKRAVDLLWLSGANLLVLDGIVSSLPDESHQIASPTTLPITPLGPGSGRWENIQSFTDYIARCQSILQAGAPDPDVLLYYPTHDLSSERGGIPSDPAKQTEWFLPTAFHRTARALIEHGISCDYASDLLIQNATVSHGRIILGGMAYKTLILPEVRQLSEITAKHLLELTLQGATLTVIGDWPRDVPGFPMPDIRRGTLFTTFQNIPESQIREGEDPIEILTELGVVPEAMASHGLRFVRRSHNEGSHYFIVNRSKQRVDAWIPLSTPAISAVLMDPRFLRRSGIAPSRVRNDRFEVQLTLEPGESRILRTFREREAEGPDWFELSPSAYPRSIAGTWNVAFISGGPELPDEYESPLLGSWTTLDDPRVDRFQGTARYSIGIEVPQDGKWLLDLGEVAHTARVTINGNEAGTSYAPPHLLDVSRFLKTGTNTLAIEVTNLPQPAPESNDPPGNSGLLGPVRLIPLTE
ncbi:glycosyl hydrolase [Haloferula chungangensis]|uniref:Glycosyl hydrolase n=1 Tax=Haloferula chungangensis TaxID=1048331 RepID=A0ABW2LE52_9BACT